MQMNEYVILVEKVQNFKKPGSWKETMKFIDYLGPNSSSHRQVNSPKLS